MALGIMSLAIMILIIMTNSLTILSLMTLSITIINLKSVANETQHDNIMLDSTHHNNIIIRRPSIIILSMSTHSIPTHHKNNQHNNKNATLAQNYADCPYAERHN